MIGLGETWTRELIENEIARIHERLDRHFNQGEPYNGNMTLDLAWCYSAAITLMADDTIEAIERGEEDRK